jgi:3-hydroxyacyl-[acyl-carrier-protein] dehydratase
MRFLLYDKVTAIDNGKSISGIKTFSLSDECLSGHFHKTALVPAVMLIESMAQLLGWLIIYTHDFKLTPFMSLIENVTVSSHLRPGFKADIRAEILSTSDRDSLGRAEMHVDGQVIGAIGRIIYSHTSKVNEHELRQLFYYYRGINASRQALGP